MHQNAAAEFREFCQNMPDPPPERIFSEVYAEESPRVSAEREGFLRYLSSFEGNLAGHAEHRQSDIPEEHGLRADRARR